MHRVFPSYVGALDLNIIILSYLIAAVHSKLMFSDATFARYTCISLSHSNSSTLTLVIAVFVYVHDW